jgi:diacylglycerol kinase family enzyme
VGVAAPAPDTEPHGIALPVDAVVTDHGTAVNLVVLGPAPSELRAWHRPHRLTVTVDGRIVHDAFATTVVIANGQFSGAADLVPRGHPGDGRLEVQVYALRASERGPMRRRLPTGTHLPHPRIVATSGRTIVVTTGGARLDLTLDGRPADRVRELHAVVRHPALRLLI